MKGKRFKPEQISRILVKEFQDYPKVPVKFF